MAGNFPSFFPAPELKAIMDKSWLSSGALQDPAFRQRLLSERGIDRRDLQPLSDLMDAPDAT